MNRALVVGIDNYPGHELHGCVNDASLIANMLETNGDGSPNFSVKLLTSADNTVTSKLLHEYINELFSHDADNVLFYFAGHGVIKNDTDSGYIVAQDGSNGAWGISLAELLGIANAAHRKNIKSVVIIIDCCHAGYLGELPQLDNPSISVIGNGVTILSSCHREKSSAEYNGQGLFTSILLDGLKGGAADICGRITPASLYNHVDQVLGAWDQRPVYKANVARFVTLRKINPKVPLEVLRRLPTYFPEPAHVYRLDPSFEPDRENIPAEFKCISVNPDNVRVFKELQLCNRHGLVEPVDAEHMYYAAINSTGCKLTAIGNHFRNLAIKKAF